MCYTIGMTQPLKTKWLHPGDQWLDPNEVWVVHVHQEPGSVALMVWYMEKVGGDIPA